MKFISLFSGIGGFDLGLERAGMECVLQVENDRRCLELLNYRWPNVPKIEDVKDIKQANIPTIDLICGGFPCQDVSLAGGRAGLAGERSGLWFEFYRIIEEAKPEWIVIENVPGLLNSNSGNDILTILNSLEDLGYIVDCDIIDAQYFGVPQRRKRVFIICQRIEDILNKKTILSAQTIAQCLIEILGGFLTEAERLSPTGRRDLDFQNSKDGMMRKIKLFGIARESQLLKLQGVLDAGLVRYQADGRSLEVEKLGDLVEDINLIITEGRLSDTIERMDIVNELWSTDSLWSNILEEIYFLAKSFTISTQPKQITESQIYFYAKAADIIGKYIILLNNCSPPCWTPVSSALIVIKEYMNYARQASNSLFTEVEWIQPWFNFISDAEYTLSELERYLRAERAAEILFERESSPWDSAPGRETGTEVARPLANSTTTNHYDESQQTYVAFGGNNTSGSIDVSTALNAIDRRQFENETFICGALPAHSPRHGHAMTTQQAAESGHLVAATLNSGGNDGGFRTEPGNHLVVAPTITGTIADGNRNGWAPVNEGDALIREKGDIGVSPGVRRLTPL